MNPSNGQTPLDYLNQIAPDAPKTSGFKLNLKTVAIGAILLVLIACIAGVAVSAVTSGRKEPWQQLSVRLATTQSVATDATKKLKNSQIRSANSDLKLYLTNVQRDVAAPLARQQIETKKLPESVTKKENGAAMIARLENARLNAKFDSTYAREMSYQLSTLLSLYQELYNSSGNKDTKAFLEQSYNNLVPIQKSFADFNASNE